MNDQKPTPEERAAFEKIEAAQGMSLVGILAIFAGFSVVQLIPDAYSLVAAIISVIAAKI